MPSKGIKEGSPLPSEPMPAPKTLPRERTSATPLSKRAVSKRKTVGVLLNDSASDLETKGPTPRRSVRPRQAPVLLSPEPFQLPAPRTPRSSKKSRRTTAVQQTMSDESFTVPDAPKSSTKSVKEEVQHVTGDDGAPTEIVKEERMSARKRRRTEKSILPEILENEQPKIVMDKVVCEEAASEWVKKPKRLSNPVVEVSTSASKNSQRKSKRNSLRGDETVDEPKPKSESAKKTKRQSLVDSVIAETDQTANLNISTGVGKENISDGAKQKKSRVNRSKKDSPLCELSGFLVMTDDEDDAVGKDVKEEISESQAENPAEITEDLDEEAFAGVKEEGNEEDAEEGNEGTEEANEDNEEDKVPFKAAKLVRMSIIDLTDSPALAPKVELNVTFSPNSSKEKTVVNDTTFSPEKPSEEPSKPRSSSTPANKLNGSGRRKSQTSLKRLKSTPIGERVSSGRKGTPYIRKVSHLEMPSVSKTGSAKKMSAEKKKRIADEIKESAKESAGDAKKRVTFINTPAKKIAVVKPTENEATGSEVPASASKTSGSASKSKIPNFAEIHRKNFEKMESISESVSRRAERAKVLLTSAKKNNAEKPKELPEQPAEKVFQFSVGVSSVKPANAARNILKPRQNETNIFSVGPLSSGYVANKPAGADDRRRALYKGRPAAFSKSRDGNQKMLKGVRLNRRFDLQMKHRADITHEAVTPTKSAKKAK